MSIQPVVAAVDGSEHSLRALDWAAAAARRRAAPLRVVHVRQYAAWAGPDVLGGRSPGPEDDPVLVEARARLAGLDDAPHATYAAPEGVITAVVPELGSDAQLLVLGSRGRGGFASLLLGSSGLAAARDAECPVVVVPPPGRTAEPGAVGGEGPRVVVGLRADSPDEPTLAFAFDEAARLGARLQVVTAYQWPVVDWAVPAELSPLVIDQTAVENDTRALAEGFLTAHRERRPDVGTELHVLPGDAAGHLVGASPGADLLVVGRHRRRLLAPARMLGSVAHAVLLHAACPVAVVPTERATA